MAALTLTVERRQELTELLGDEERLNTMYPVVADYLDTVMNMPGSGDASADASFDLRLVHYLTGGANESGNPYWDLVSDFTSTLDSGRRVVDGGRPNGSARLGYAQMVLQKAYAYAIPSPETIDWVRRTVGGLRVLELGAGRGYWAAQLAAAGVDVRAFDSHPPSSVANESCPNAEGLPATWFDVRGTSEYAAEPKESAVLMLCWPPGWGDAMASRALDEFVEAGGRSVLFIGEPRGKTGDDAFFDRLDAAWSLTSEDAAFVSWCGNSDVAQLWTRR